MTKLSLRNSTDQAKTTRNLSNIKPKSKKKKKPASNYEESFLSQSSFHTVEHWPLHQRLGEIVLVLLSVSCNKLKKYVSH